MKITCPNCRGRARLKVDGALAEHTNNFGAVCRLVGKTPEGLDVRPKNGTVGSPDERNH